MYESVPAAIQKTEKSHSHLRLRRCLLRLKRIWLFHICLAADTQLWMSQWRAVKVFLLPPPIPCCLTASGQYLGLALILYSSCGPFGISRIQQVLQCVLEFLSIPLRASLLSPPNPCLAFSNVHSRNSCRENHDQHTLHATGMLFCFFLQGQEPNQQLWHYAGIYNTWGFLSIIEMYCELLSSQITVICT